jgi:hypothetical protein
MDWEGRGNQIAEPECVNFGLKEATAVEGTFHNHSSRVGASGGDLLISSFSLIPRRCSAAGRYQPANLQKEQLAVFEEQTAAVGSKTGGRLSERDERTLRGWTVSVLLNFC